jgi:putative FmdB family regulatory protein
VPTYQYQCTECGEALEVVQKFSDDALTVCPNCEGALRKVFSAVGIVFKGSGFYRNDSRSASTSSTPPAAAGGSSSANSSSAGSSSTGTGTGTGGASTPAKSGSTGGSAPAAAA